MGLGLWSLKRIESNNILGISYQRFRKLVRVLVS
jgi:hypothetical protein